MGKGDIRLLRVEEAAKQLGVHPETIRKWVREGKLVGRRDKIRAGGPVYIEQQDLLAFRDRMQGL